MRRFIVMIAFFGLVIFGICIALVPSMRAKFFGFVKEQQRQLTGYSPAKTPDEACTLFAKAIKDRNYDVAADVYLGGPYAEQMRKAAPAASKLGQAIDNLLEMIEFKNYKSDKVKYMLYLLEPFPREIEFVNRQHQGESKVVAQVSDQTTVKFSGDAYYYNVQMDPKFTRALVRGMPQGTAVEIRLEGPGKEKAWRIYFPLVDETIVAVNRLNDQYKVYVKALESLKEDVRQEPMDQATLNERVRTKLEQAAKD